MTRTTPSTSTTATCHKQPRHPVRAFRLATCAHGLSLDIEIEESRPSYTIDSMFQRSCSRSTLWVPYVSPILRDMGLRGLHSDIIPVFGGLPLAMDHRFSHAAVHGFRANFFRYRHCQTANSLAKTGSVDC